jgi:hypothetical protein
MRFILWDQDRGEPLRGNGGEYLTSGAIGVIDEENVYLATYAKYPDARRPKDLPVHGRICGVEYSMAWTHGVYDIIRID